MRKWGQGTAPLTTHCFDSERTVHSSRELQTPPRRSRAPDFELTVRDSVGYHRSCSEADSDEM